MTAQKINTIVIQYGMVLTDLTVNQGHLDMIKDAAPDADVVIIRNADEWQERADELGPRADVMYGLRPAMWFAQMPNLAWAQQTGAGADWLAAAPEVVNSDMILTNASGVHAIPIAEHILALMFAFGRVLHLNIRSQARGKWERGGQVLELDGATLGVVGVGQIGSKTAEKAKALNMNVLGLRRNKDRSDPSVDKMYGPEDLNEMLAECDWVAVTAAMTPETKEMFTSSQFEAMKESAVIINIARGSVIRESDLAQALENGDIAGAGLDVFEKEPLPEDSPLWQMENVIITPHYAGATPHYVDRLMAIFVENLRLYQAGQPLINVVDKKLGY